MAYQVLVKGTLHSDAEEVWRGDTFLEARERARRWLNMNGKPGEAVAQIWDEDRTNLSLTLHVDADGLIHDDAGSDRDRVQLVWTLLREIVGASKVSPGRYDVDHKEYRFAIEGGYTVTVTREYLRETQDLAADLKAKVTLERIRTTGTKRTLVLTSDKGIVTRPNQA